MIRRAALAVTGGAALIACAGHPAAPAAPSGPPLDATWPALDGGEVRLAELRGQRVVIHVFTTWAAAADLDNDQLAAADGADDVTVIDLALDPEGYTMVAPWRRATGVRFLVALADDATRAGTGPLGPVPEVPTTLVIDRSGRLVARLAHQLAPGELAAAIARTR